MTGVSSAQSRVFYVDVRWLDDWCVLRSEQSILCRCEVVG